MKLNIHHHSRYNYSGNVFLEPQYLNFHPLQRPYLDLLKFNMKVDPQPAGTYILVNSDNHLQHQCWFSGQQDFLDIKVDISVEVSGFNPFGFYIDPSRKLSHDKLSHFLDVSEDINQPMVDMLSAYREHPQTEISSVISEILNMINSNWEHKQRYKNNILSPSACFERRDGSCRDLSWMMIIMLRYLGIPARFISGYAYNPDLGEGHELHAWVEFFASGAGWIAVDPSAGIFCTETYIPVSSSAIPSDTLPVTGNFRGDIHSSLDTSVTIEKA